LTYSTKIKIINNYSFDLKNYLTGESQKIGAINFKDLHCYKKIAQAYIEKYNFVLFLFIKNVLL